MAKVRDKYILHSKNGTDYYIEIMNVNDFREPDMKYGVYVHDVNGIYADDVQFIGDKFLEKCEKVSG